MSEAIIENPQVVEVDPAEVPLKDKKLDKGFKRNIIIISAAIIIAVGATAAIVIATRAKISEKQSVIASTSVNVGGSTSQAPEKLTQSDAERLNRVQVKQSEAAKAGDETYIPKELPLNTELRPPAASNAGPGGFNQAGVSQQQQQQQQAQLDVTRGVNIQKGLELQLASLLAKFEPPGTGSAGPYSTQAKNSATASSTGTGTQPVGSAAPIPMAAASAPDVLIGALKFSSARLVSPLDTSKTDFVSVEITSGTLQGAYLIGKGRLVGETGVTLDFTRMAFEGEDYRVDARALDDTTSSDSVAADVDRKLLSRTVFPVVFSTLQAYLTAVAKPGSTVTGGILETQVSTPAATSRQAAAAGLAAGVGKLSTDYVDQKPTAYMPVNTSISLIFNAPVLRKAAK